MLRLKPSDLALKGAPLPHSMGGWRSWLPKAPRGTSWCRDTTVPSWYLRATNYTRYPFIIWVRFDPRWGVVAGTYDGRGLIHTVDNRAELARLAISVTAFMKLEGLFR